MAANSMSRNLHLFTCCVHKALEKESFTDFSHIHNLTFKCHVHNEYDGYDNYMKKIMQMVFNKSNMQPLADYCNGSNPMNFTTSQLTSELGPTCSVRTQTWYNMYVILWLLVFIFGVVGNFLVLSVFFRSKKLYQNAENYLVASLATSDLLVMFFIVPIKIHYSLHNFKFCAPVSVCILYMMTDHLFFAASILNILALTIARYITIIKPYSYRRIITSRNVKLTLGAVWTTAITVSVMTRVDINHGHLDGIVIESYICKIRHKDQLNQMLLYVFVFFLPCLIMLVIYIHIDWISKSHSKVIKYDSRRINASKNNSGHNSQRRNSNKISIIIQQSASFINKKLESRATKILILLFGSFVFCWLPVIIVIYLKAYNVIRYISPGYYAILQILPIFHSTLDPFIYGILHRDFKSSLKKMLGISFLSYQRRGSGSNFKKSYLSTARSNVDAPSNHSSHRPSDSSFNLPSPQDEIRRTEDGYPIYKVQDFSKNIDSLAIQPTEHDELRFHEDINKNENTKMLNENITPL